jgi:exosortase
MASTIEHISDEHAPDEHVQEGPASGEAEATQPAPPPTSPDRKAWDWAGIAPLAVATALFIALSWPLLRWWHYEFTKPESYYEHAPIIPFIVGLMFWYRREALAAVPLKPSLTALIVLVSSLALLVVAQKREMEALMSVGFLATLWSSVWLLCGARFVRAAAFPLAFLILMAPLPGPLLNDATLRIQMASTVLAEKILHPIFGSELSGNVIHMENFSLFVDVPCSGFKLLLSLLTFSAAFAYLVDGAPRRRLALFLFSLPLSLIVNSVRIALIGVVGECLGADAAHVFHDWSGIITLGLGFVMLFSLAKVAGCRKFAGWPIF